MTTLRNPSRRRPSPPKPKTIRVTATLPVYFVDVLDEFAAAIDTSRADALRMIVTPQVMGLRRVTEQAKKLKHEKTAYERAIRKAFDFALTIEGLAGDKAHKVHHAFPSLVSREPIPVVGFGE